MRFLPTSDGTGGNRFGFRTLRRRSRWSKITSLNVRP